MTAEGMPTGFGPLPCTLYAADCAIAEALGAHGQTVAARVWRRYCLLGEEAAGQVVDAAHCPAAVPNPGREATDQEGHGQLDQPETDEENE